MTHARAFPAAGVAALLPAPALASAAPVPSATASMLQAGVGLLVVIGLILLCAWGARRFGLQPSGTGRTVKVVASTGLGPRERVVVVELGSQWLVLGVAPGRVNHLHTLPAPQLPEAAPGPGQPVPPGFAAADGFARKLRAALSHRQGPA